jgi:hypothetical protein
MRGADRWAGATATGRGVEADRWLAGLGADVEPQPASASANAATRAARRVDPAVEGPVRRLSLTRAMLREPAGSPARASGETAAATAPRPLMLYL